MEESLVSPSQDLNLQNTSEFPKTQLHKNIYLTFENLNSCLEASLKEVLSSGSKNDYQMISKIRNIFSPFESILESSFAQWRFLQNQEEGYFCEHTFGTMVVLFKNPDYLELSENDQMLLMWTMLFHDIHKRGRPTLYCRDPFHPFPSALRTLEILIENGLIVEKDYLSEFRTLIETSFRLDETYTEIIDYINIDQIFKGFLYFTGIWDSTSEDFTCYRLIEEGLSDNQRFYFEMLILILFHQSLDINPFFPNPSYLNKLEVLKYLSPRLVKLLHIVHIADHNSYYLGRCKYNNWPNNQRISTMVAKYLELFQISQ